MQWTGEDIFTNISLQSILLQLGIGFPDFDMPEEKDSITKYFKKINNEILKMPKWRVVSDIYLGFFSFTKFVMYKDLDTKVWPHDTSPVDHPLIRQIFDPKDKEIISNGFDQNEIDYRLKYNDIFHVMDADPSQISVIQDVKKGRNLVVEGPPGTGKSQTITNIIAELLGTGKSILFVSEKMAALEVVKSRLDKVGLGDFCLELHSRKSRKKDVLEELQRTISRNPSTFTVDEQIYIQLENVKIQLNQYAKALRSPIGKIDLTPYQLYGIKENSRMHFKKVQRSFISSTLPDSQECTKEDYNSLLSKLDRLSGILNVIGSLKEHPWKGCEPTQILPIDIKRIENLLTQTIDALNELILNLEKLVAISGICPPKKYKDLPVSIETSKLIAISKPIDKNVLLNEEWNQRNQNAEALIDTLEIYYLMKKKIINKFNFKAINIDVSTLFNEFKSFSKKKGRIFYPRYRAIKKELKSYYRVKPARRDFELLKDIEQLVKFIQICQYLKKHENSGKALFGSHWKGLNSDLAILKNFSKWIISFRMKLIQDALSTNAVQIVCNGISKDQIEKITNDVINSANRYINCYEQLKQSLKFNHIRIYGKKFKEVDFSQIMSKLKLWSTNVDKIQHWSQYITIKKYISFTIAQPLLAIIEQGELVAEDIIPCFKASFADSLLIHAFQKMPVLANFVGAIHERDILTFTELDNKSIHLNRYRLINKLNELKPKITGGASPHSEVGILLGEFNKKRRQMPIRQLMINTSGLIQKIKPCFMMSPLSIAQYLDPKIVRFDVIIFDEASQVRPEDALGALLRGNQVVVMGDTKQLPPTTFFDKMVDDEEEDEEEVRSSVSDIESILHLCRRSFPTNTLRWHYRSRHQTLIAVSNQEFYDNQLLIYPSPIDRSDKLGLKFVYMPDTIYDRGRSSVNRKEAKAVAQAAVKHFQKYPEKSLGIGAFNIKQQHAILEEIELLQRQNHDIEILFSMNKNETFFVKNLETIQGDERDVIFISIGFGYDQNRKLTMNFGPLNQEGGERRLNVLVTRAREKCIVFSNFKAGDIPIDSSSPFGLRALKTYIEFADTGNLRSDVLPINDTDSPFEDSVYEFLKRYGYEVRKQVGCAGFRIDLAIVNNESRGEYLLGIECDGAKYHNSPVARDRDRLRQQILENLGWKIYRIWSTDWYRNPNAAQKNLIEAIENLKSGTELITNRKSGNIKIETESIFIKKENITELISENSFDKHFNNIVPEYKRCTNLGIPIYGELYEYPINQLSQGVIRIVNVEGPVHIEEIIRRIRMSWGLKRSGNRIFNSIKSSIDHAQESGSIKIKGDFLWPISNPKNIVRRRNSDLLIKIDYICNEEIEESIKLVLQHQYATLPEDLIVKSSRLLGFKSTNETIYNKIKLIVNDLISNNLLKKQQNGMLCLTD